MSHTNKTKETLLKELKNALALSEKYSKELIEEREKVRTLKYENHQLLEENQRIKSAPQKPAGFQIDFKAPVKSPVIAKSIIVEKLIDQKFTMKVNRNEIAPHKQHARIAGELVHVGDISHEMTNALVSLLDNHQVGQAVEIEVFATMI